MSTPKTIRIDNEEYVRASDVQQTVTGDKHIVVLDRGWIFVGNLTEEQTDDDNATLWRISNAYNIRKWSKGGLGLLTRNPKEAEATLDKSQDVLFRDCIYRVNAPDSWGTGL